MGLDTPRLASFLCPVPREAAAAGKQMGGQANSNSKRVVVDNTYQTDDASEPGFFRWGKEFQQETKGPLFPH
ncbi:hypothetical protein SAMD00023353_1401330 [Rosellinia necatrix]|uniref:Uncharacterized protein n=1 Tax=Rosellinia necatrix TaxID=77044 RepID=A0A1S8A7F0_ROSNE|nr:hypothetical protein SAMD00023353_1401330 [Rosellinia necatrix]